MNKLLLLTLSCMLFLSVAAFGQKNGNNNNSAESERGRTNLLLPYGNIGIGTLSPSEKLEVLGSIRASNSIFAQTIEVIGLNANTISIGEDLEVGRNILVSGNIGIGVMNPAERLEISGNLRVSDQIFSDKIEINTLLGNTGTFNQNLLVKDRFIVEGMTGLGVSSPVERLEVAGNVKATENLISTGVQAQTGSFSSSVDINEKLTVNGNTGLGVANPTERLELEGNMKVSNGIFTNTLEGSSFSMGEGTVENTLSVNGNTLVGGNVGIGNTAPAEKLEVNGNIKATGNVLGQDLQMQNGAFGNDVSISRNLAVEGSTGFTGEVQMVDATVANALNSNVFTTESGTVNGVLNVGGNTTVNGNTGLGVEQPAERLEVAGNAKISHTLYANALESKEISLENGNIENQLNVGGNTLVGGNIGVGTETPTERLEVAGNIKATGNFTGENISAQKGDFASDVNVASNLAVTGTSDFTGEVTAVDLTVSNSLKSNSLTIDNGNIANELTVGGNTLVGGNIGIGNTAPTERLDVTGNIKASGDFMGQNISAQKGDFASDVNVANNLAVTGTADFTGEVTAVDLTVSNSLKSNSLTIDNGNIEKQLNVGGNTLVGGNIGVGTETPTERLDVTGNIKASGDFIGENISAQKGDFASDINVGNNLAVTGASNFTGEVTAVDLTVTNTLKSNSLSIDNGNIENQLNVGGNTLVGGNIGIGNTAPSERLDVTGNIKASGDLMGETISAKQGDFASDVNVGNNLAVTGTSDFTGEVTVADLTVTNTLKSNGMSMDNGNVVNELKVGGNTLISGNIGIGSAAPTERLDVSGNIKSSENLMSKGVQAETGQFSTSLAVPGVADFSGSVTMETLQVNSTLESYSIQAESGAFSGQLEVTGAVALDNTLYVKDALSIGTDKVSGYMLSVNGKIRAGDDIRVYPSAEWADYVFEESYQMPSLLELEQYIRLNHHLPQIPSALKVKKEGIELGAMDARLLQKIEELTLYTIAQEKILAQQKEQFEQKDQEIQTLRSELEELKALVKELAARD